MRKVSAIEREVARSARAHSESGTKAAKDGSGCGSATSQVQREARHAALQDVVKAVVVWTVFALLHCSLVWALAHFTISLQLSKHTTGVGWMLLGCAPVCTAERVLQRTAAGIKLRGISGDGPVRCFSAPLPAILVLPALPGAPWFGSRRVRLALGLAAGVWLAAVDRFASPFLAAVAGCSEAVLLLLRAAFAAIWICDWRLQQLWRKKK
ncbi:unnamed protein product [Effrenium voratum]|nr:unnamed protein product [Effrenium voratum]